MDSPRRHTIDDVCWQVAPDWEETLLGPAGLRLDEWLRAGQAQIIKDGLHRTVYRLDLAGGTLFLKHYRCRPLMALRHLIRPSASRREWRKAVELSRRAIPTARPVAVGEQQRVGLVLDSFFVTEAIPDSRSLDHFAAEVLPRLERAQRERLRREILEGLAQLAAEAHRAGVFHNDLHTGNVLVRWGRVLARRGAIPPPAGGWGSPQPAPPVQLYLIDLPGVRFSGPLGWSRSRDSLVMLGSGWLARLSRSDRRRFWKAYLAGRPELALLNPSAAAAEVERRMRDFARSIARGRDKRALRDNRDFYRLAGRWGVGHAVKELPVEELARLLQDPERLLRKHRHEPVKISHSSLVVEATLALSTGPVRVALKRWRPKRWWKALAAWFRPSRAIENWYLGHALLQRGIATARPLAVCEPKQRGLFRHSYLATEWIEGALNLHLYGWELGARPAADARRRLRQAAESLGRLIGRMHAWQIGHRDLKGCNLVFVERPDEVEAYLIDLDGLHLARRLSPACRARNLARLAASLEAHPWVPRSVRVYFLRAYLAEYSPGESWKDLWLLIAPAAARVVGRLARRGLPPA